MQGKKIIQFIDSQREFLKDTKKQVILLNFLYRLVQSQSLQTLEIIKNLLNEKVIPHYPERLQFAEDIMAFGYGEKLHDSAAVDSLSQILIDIFKEEFGINDSDFMKKYQKTFAQFRKKEAIVTYASRLKKASERELPLSMAKKLLGTFIKSVLNGTFYHLRYDRKGQEGLHLQQVFQNRDELEKQWRSGCSALSTELLGKEEEASEEKVFDFRRFFIEKIFRDQHLGSDVQNAYPYLTQGLTEREAVNSFLTQIGQAINDHVYELRILKKQHLVEKKEEVEDKLKKLRLQKVLLELSQSHGSAEAVAPLVRKAFEAVPKDCELRNDLEGFMSLKRGGPSNDWIVVDTDDPCDLLLCGTEVYGSCQRVDAEAKYNICLLAYLLDGKNRLIAVKNKEGEIIARCILRLLLTKETKQPVLFQERLYVNNNNQDAQALVEAMCKRRAKALKLPLVKAGPKPIPGFEVKEDPSEPTFGESVVSLGGRSAYEYVDALGSEHRSNQFEITGCRVIYSP